MTTCAGQPNIGLQRTSAYGLAAGAALLLQLSCAATVLAPTEEKVRITENASDVMGCQVLGPVEARGPYKVPDEWKIQFRNQGLQLGADTVVLKQWSLLAQSFSGMAYRCAQAAAAETAALVPAPPPAPVADAPRVVPPLSAGEFAQIATATNISIDAVNPWDETLANVPSQSLDRFLNNPASAHLTVATTDQRQIRVFLEILAGANLQATRERDGDIDLCYRLTLATQNGPVIFYADAGGDVLRDGSIFRPKNDRRWLFKAWSQIVSPKELSYAPAK